MRAEEIPGWMEPIELDWLRRQARKRHLIVEIGSYQGRSTRALVEGTPGVVIAIDNWKGPTDTKCDRENVQQKFWQHMEGLTHKVIAVDADHRADLPFQVYPDMVFIDGDHDYDAVKADIEKWWKVLQPGGLMSGHDYETCWSGVKQAVDELFGDAIRVDTTIWSIKKGE